MEKNIIFYKPCYQIKYRFDVIKKWLHLYINDIKCFDVS
jgi:hypothetical protein